MSEKPKHPPVVEVVSGDETSFARAERGSGHEDFRDKLRRKLLGQHAVETLARQGELLGVVTEVDAQGEKVPGKVIRLDNEDLGTEVFTDNPNPYARSHRMQLPGMNRPRANTPKELYDARVKSTEERELEESAAETQQVSADVIHKAEQPADEAVDDDDYYANFRVGRSSTDVLPGDSRDTVDWTSNGSISDLAARRAQLRRNNRS